MPPSPLIRMSDDPQLPSSLPGEFYPQLSRSKQKIMEPLNFFRVFPPSILELPRSVLILTLRRRWSPPPRGLSPSSLPLYRRRLFAGIRVRRSVFKPTPIFLPPPPSLGPPFSQKHPPRDPPFELPSFLFLIPFLFFPLPGPATRR